MDFPIARMWDIYLQSAQTRSGGHSLSHRDLGGKTRTADRGVGREGKKWTSLWCCERVREGQRVREEAFVSISHLDFRIAAVLLQTCPFQHNTQKTAVAA